MTKYQKIIAVSSEIICVVVTAQLLYRVFNSGLLLSVLLSVLQMCVKSVEPYPKFHLGECALTLVETTADTVRPLL